MKIIQIFGAVVAVHLLAFIFIFASPGCQSGPRNLPTPDATMPSSAPAPVSFNTATPQPVDLGTPTATYTPAPASGHAVPTRPGSAAAVAVTPPKPVENVAPVSTYTVERGDSLWSIAKKHGLSVSELAKLNNVSTGTALKPGRKLVIPAKSAPKDLAAVPASGMSLPAEKTPVPARATNGAAEKYTVQVGESLGLIAKKFSITVGELVEANNITDPAKVRAGQQIMIPGRKGFTPKPATPATTATAATPKPAATAPAPTPAEPAAAAPRFEITAPPPGQDLDAGLKATDTVVPTIKVEEAAPTTK